MDAVDTGTDPARTGFASFQNRMKTAINRPKTGGVRWTPVMGAWTITYLDLLSRRTS